MLTIGLPDPLYVPTFGKFGSFPTTIYLDFNGHQEQSTGLPDKNGNEIHNVRIDPYDTDGDLSSFSKSEIDEIAAIWSGVNEAFSPFNVNVTTNQAYDDVHDKDRGVLRVAIGGDGRWYNDDAKGLMDDDRGGGVAMRGSYNLNTLVNTVYVWDDWFSPRKNTLAYWADAAVHEAGHAFGLRHQSKWANGELTEEYRQPDPTTNVGPFMGRSDFYDTDGNGSLDRLAIPRWAKDLNVLGNVQDDLGGLSYKGIARILTSEIKIGPWFGYRDDDHTDSDSVSLATRLPDVPFGSVIDTGIIEQVTDVDYFTFTARSTEVQIDVDVAPFRAMLNPRVEILDSSGAWIAGASSFSTSAESKDRSISVNPNTKLVPGRQYLVGVSSTGGYGNIGQYTLRVTQLPDPQIIAPEAVAIGQFPRLEGRSGFSSSYDSYFTYEWDLDDDHDSTSVFAGFGETDPAFAKRGVEVGKTVTFDPTGYPELKDGSLHPIRLKVTDPKGNSSTTTKYIRIDNSLLYAPSSTGLPQLAHAEIAWGDIDADGDDDLAISGLDHADLPVTKIFRNDNGTLVDLNAALTPTQADALAWADHDNDGDLDLLVVGGALATTQLYENLGDSFSPVDAGLMSLSAGAAGWGDYDNDGDVDLLLSGLDASGQAKTALYRNDRGTFALDPTVSLPNVSHGSFDWADFDVDGDLDVLMTGLTNSGPITEIYQNESGGFVEVPTEFPGVSHGSALWGDLTQDGRLDVLLTGVTETGPLTQFYRFDRVNPFTGIHVYRPHTDLPDLANGAAVFGDYDNDGDLDILISGEDNGGAAVTKIYRSKFNGPSRLDDDNFFVGLEDLGAGLNGATNSAAGLSDIDGDGDLDLLVAGAGNSSGSEMPLTTLYRSHLENTNRPPNAPLSLSYEVLSETEVRFQWEIASDIGTWKEATENHALSYNLRVGTTPGGSEIMSPGVGWNGNVGRNTEWVLKDLEQGRSYYWSVDVIDQSGNRRQSQELVFGKFFAADANYSVNGFVDGDAKWVDLNNDGFLDLIVVGESLTGPRTSVYENTGTGLVEVGSSIPNLSEGAIDVGDFDRDGRIDVVLTGRSDSGPYSAVFRNTTTGLELHSSLVGVAASDVAWVDIDNDGDLDAALAGAAADGTETFAVYENEANTFSLLPTNVPGFSDASFAWQDIDHDGWVDLAIGGSSNGRNPVLVFRNIQGELVLQRSLGEFSLPSLVWADADLDGWSDLLVAGDYFSFIPYAVIFRDVQEGINPYRASLTSGLRNASVGWVDFDNDGDSDILLNGLSGITPTTTLFNNDTSSGGFTSQTRVQSIDLPHLSQGGFEWADVDGDGDLDAFAFGLDESLNPIAELYVNQLRVTNVAPAAPTGLVATTYTADSVYLAWNLPADAETGEYGLTYALQVGTTSGGTEIASSMSVGATRQTSGPASIRRRDSNTLTGLEWGQTYYWSVQAIDSSWSASELSTEHSFVFNNPPHVACLITTSVAENNLVGHLVSVLVSSDLDTDAGDLLSFSLVPGDGDTDNSSFQIVDDQLLALESFNFEQQDTYSIRVRVEDSLGGFSESALQIEILDVNETPTAISLSSQSITENTPGGVVGIFATEDPDFNEVHRYTITDDAAGVFDLYWNYNTQETSLTLKRGRSLDFETQDSYSITIQSADSGDPALTTSETFVITVDDVDERAVKLMQDININTDDSNAKEFVQVGENTFFVADDGVHGEELWVSDGTEEGTRMVVDLYAGALGSRPQWLVEFNGSVFFAANDGLLGTELWKSDGTAAGTVMVANIESRYSTASSNPEQLTVVGDQLFFVADVAAYGKELWVSDGTAGGTRLVRDINTQPYFGGTADAGIDAMTPFDYNRDGVDDSMMLMAYDGSNGGIWISDGSSSGTRRVRSFSAAYQQRLVRSGNYVYYVAYDNTYAWELWRTDGTGSGNVRLTNAPYFGSWVGELADFNGTLYFGAGGGRLWKSSGSPSNTSVVTQLNPEGGSGPTSLVASGNRLFFYLYKESTGAELWSTTGTASGTRLVKEINPGPDHGLVYPPQMIDVGGTLYFVANDGQNGDELWRSDGSSQGTYLVKDITSGAGSTTFNALTDLGDRVAFQASTDATGAEPWISFGSLETTNLLKDVNTETVGSDPDSSVILNNVIYFASDDGIHGRELWRTDGTVAGTHMLKDILPGQQSSNPTELTIVNGIIYFSATDAESGTELWRSDGTDAGTYRVDDILPGASGSAPESLTELNGTLLFEADGGNYGRQLWKYDGGTPQLVKRVNPSGDARLEYLEVAGNRLFFSAYNPTLGIELWTSDGTAAGTYSLDINPGSGHSYAQSLVGVGDTLFLIADNGQTGRELWASDGTIAGTQLVKDTIPGTGYGIRGQLAKFGSGVVFVAWDPVNRYGLWQSDGTALGTNLISGVEIGENFTYYPKNFTEIDGRLYFTAFSEDFGAEVWSTDGTAPGTMRLTDINTGRGTAFHVDDFGGEHWSPNFTNLDGTVFFAAMDSALGPELWMYDPSLGQTTLVTDINSGRDGSMPTPLGILNGDLLFTAEDGSHGREIWKTSTKPVANPDLITLPEDGSATLELLVNDVEPNGQPLSIYTFTQPAFGTLANNGDGTLTYVPNLNYFGADSFEYTITDGQDGFDTSSVSLVVEPVNDRPTYSASDPAAVLEDAGTQIIHDWAAFLPGPVNESGQLAASYVVSNVSNPDLFAELPRVSADGTLWYAPALNANGTSTFDLVVVDNGGSDLGGNDTSNLQTFQITVNAANDAPTVAAPTSLFAESGVAVDVTGVVVTDVDLEPTGTDLVEVTLSAIQGAMMLGQLTGLSFVNGNNGDSSFSISGTLVDVNNALNSLAYRSTEGNFGPDTITIATSDLGNRGSGGPLSGSATVNVTVLPRVSVPVGATSTEVLREGDDLVVRKDAANEYFRAPLADVEGLVVAGNVDSESVTIIVDGLTSAELPQGIRVSGGEGVGDNDDLALEGSQTITNHQYTTGGPESGVIVLDGLTVFFEEFEPIFDYLNSLNRSFVVGTSGDQEMLIEDDGDLANGRLRIQPGVDGGFERIEFYAPLESLTVTGNDDDNHILLGNLEEAANMAVVLIGGDGNDSIDASAFIGTLQVQGGDGDDQISAGKGFNRIEGGDGDDEVLDNGGDNLISGGSGMNRFLSAGGLNIFESFSDSGLGGFTDNYVTDEDVVLEVSALQGLLANDSIPFGQSATIEIVDPPSLGNLELALDGSFVYTPRPNANGTETFTYRISTENASSSEIPVKIEINSVNDLPVAGDDLIWTAEDQPRQVRWSDLLKNDIDEDGDALTAGLTSLPTNGQLLESDAGVLAYIPNPEFFGRDQFEYTVADPGGGSYTATVVISVSPVEDAPTIDLENSVDRVDEGSLASASGSFGDTDPGDTLQLTATVGNVIDEGDGKWSWTYLPIDGPYDSQRVMISVSDGSTTSSLEIDLVVNNAPVSFDAGPSITLLPDKEGAFTRHGITFADSGADQWEGTVDYGDDTPTQPLIIDSANKSFNLDHTYTEEDTFTVTVKLKDDDSEFVVSSFQIDVLFNQPPIAVDDLVTLGEDDTVVDITGVAGDASFGLLGNDTDPDGDSVTVVAIDDSTISAGILRLKDGVVTFDPNGEFESLALHENRLQAFEYTIADPSGETSTATATIEIRGANDAPTVRADLNTISIAEGQTAANQGSFEDPDATNSVALVASIGKVVDAGDGRWTWAYDGTDDLRTTSVIITATDEDGEVSTATFDLTVNNVAPTLSDASFSLVENSPVGTSVGSVSATDPGNDTLTFSITGGSGATAFAIDPATGEISVADSTQLDFETTTSFDLEVTVSDGDGGFDTANVQIDLINLASISGVVFVDVNQDGLFDANEPGIDGVMVELRDENGNAVLDAHGIAITNLTSDGGLYLFDDLAPGIYQLHEVQPTGVVDGEELLGTLGGVDLGDDTMQLAITDIDAHDYAFAEIGQQVASGDAAGIGFWQSKHGQALIASGEADVAIWLTERFGNVFGDSLVGATGQDVATFYRNELFKQKSKKSAGPAKVDAQFMAVALATYFTSSQLAGTVASSYGFNVTDTGIGTRVVNVGSAGAAFDVANDTEMTILQLLDATNSLTDQPDSIDGFAHIYDRDGNGSIDSREEKLRRLANDLYGWINEQGGI